MNTVYTSKGTKVQGVYRDKHQLIVQPGAVFPDVFIGCGKPAWGNTIPVEFSGFPWLFVLPPGFDVLAHLLLGRRYHFDFPFCPSCPPYLLQLRKIRLDSHLAIFVGRAGSLPTAFLDSLPTVPQDVAVEENRSWLERRFRWLYE